MNSNAIGPITNRLYKDTETLTTQQLLLPQHPTRIALAADPASSSYQLQSNKTNKHSEVWQQQEGC